SSDLLEFEKSSTEFSSVEAETEKLRLDTLHFEKTSSSDYETLIQLKEKFSELDKQMELSAQRTSILQNQIREREKDLERIRSKREAHASTITEVVEARDKLQKEWEERKVVI